MTEDQGRKPSSSQLAAALDGEPQVGAARPRPSVAPRLAGILLILAFAILYGFTLDNGLRPGELEGGDLITHQYAQVQGRPGNAPGYPLYTMGGWLWFHLGRAVLGPESNPIPILSSYSTLWALLALWLLYRLILEITGRGHGGNWPVAALVTAFYGATYFFWYYAVTTEQYTSAVAWTLAGIILAFRWERARRVRTLLLLALLVGIGLAHMVTVLFLVPPLLWFLLSTEPRLLRRPRLVAAAIGLMLLPLLSYAFVYFAGAAHPEWQGSGPWSSSWQWFWSFLSTRQGRGELTWALTPFLTAEFPALIGWEMTGPGLLLGLCGLATLGRRRAIFLYATLAIYLVFSWVDRLGNWYQVIMPAYAILALGIAGAVNWIWQLGSSRAEERRGRSGALSAAKSPHGVPWQQQEAPPGHSERVGRPTLAAANHQRRISRLSFVLLLGLLISLVIYRGVRSYPLADSSDRPDDTGLAPGWAILADQPPEGVRVLATAPEALALDYLAEIWGVRPDVRTVTSTRARHILAAGSPPLTATEAALPLVPEEVSPDAHYSALGGRLVEIKAGPFVSLPAGGPAWREQAWRYDFGGLLSLMGGRARRDAAGGEAVVLLAWQAPARISENWSVSVRLTEGDTEIAQVDRRHPVAGAYPTSRWQPGEVVGDAYSFILPAGAAPDGVTVIVYRALPDGSFTNLGVARLPLQ
jgi:hypothetical protein